MALSYQKDLQELYAQNFDSDVVTHFPDGLFYGALDLGAIYINLLTGVDQPDQPDAGDDVYFVRFSVSDGVTFNDTIQDGVTQTKRLLTFVEVSVFFPETRSKKQLVDEIEPRLDEIFLNLKFRGSDDSEIFNQQDSPRLVTDVSRSGNGNPWNRKDIQYPFLVRYK